MPVLTARLALSFIASNSAQSVGPPPSGEEENYPGFIASNSAQSVGHYWGY